MQVLMRFEADYDVVLECIQEVYGLECDNLRLGKDFRKTMVLPFMKMLERHCGGIRMENLHKVLWEVYQESTAERFSGKGRHHSEAILQGNIIVRTKCMRFDRAALYERRSAKKIPARVNPLPEFLLAIAYRGSCSGSFCSWIICS